MTKKWNNPWAFYHVNKLNPRVKQLVSPKNKNLNFNVLNRLKDFLID